MKIHRAKGRGLWQGRMALGCALGLIVMTTGCAQFAAQRPQTAAPPVQAPPISEAPAPSTQPAPPIERTQEVSPPPPLPAQPLPALKPAVAQAAPSPAARNLVLNFDNADVFTVVRTIGQMLGINYIIEPTVGPGRVTIHASGKFSKEEIFPILETILDVNNLAITKVGPLYRIGPLAEARQRPLEAYVGREAIVKGDRVIIQVIPLNFLPASAMEGVLRPLVTKAGTFLPVPGTNSLVVVDLASNVGKLLEVIGLLDINTFDRIQVKLYPVRHADAEGLAKELEDLFAQLGYSKGREVLRFLPIARLGAILVVNAFADLGPSIERWIETLDQPSTQAEEEIFVYYVENAKATSLADILNSLYRGRGEAKAPAPRPGPPAPAAPPPAPPGPRLRTPGPFQQPGAPAPATGAVPVPAGPPAPPTGPAGAPDAGAAVPSGEIRILADEAINALIIAAPPRQYPAILETIKKLDIPKKQVLVETLVAEMTLDDSTQFGLEWSLRTTGRIKIGGQDYFLTSTPTANFGTLFTPQPSLLGFTSVVTETDRILGMLRALSEANRINILSSPNILATDNKTAVINIGDSIPILTSQTSTAQTTGGVQNITQTIQYVDTGIILTVTPHINEKRMVVMDIKQEVSNAVPNKIGGTDSPIIQKRTADTSAVVADGQTVLIGGLMTEARSQTRTGIPFLSKIPILGYLFGATDDSVQKRELIILITPRVIGSPEDARSVRERFEERVKSLQGQIRKQREEK